VWYQRHAVLTSTPQARNGAFTVTRMPPVAGTTCAFVLDAKPAVRYAHIAPAAAIFIAAQADALRAAEIRPRLPSPSTSLPGMPESAGMVNIALP